AGAIRDPRRASGRGQHARDPARRSQRRGPEADRRLPRRRSAWSPPAKATPREALMGALAVPALAALPGVALARGGGAVLLHDPSLEAGRRLAEAHRGEVLAIAGDRIRFARAVFARRPSLVLGVSRAADALL